MGDSNRARGFLTPEAEHYRVQVPGYEGRTRIAHLTDLHFGKVTPVELQRQAVAHANESDADLVVLTGDFVARSLGYLDSLTEVLSGLDAHAIAVMGNHDHWTGVDEVKEALDKAGVEVIDNAWTRVGSGEDALAIVAIDDHGTGHDDPDQATKGLHQAPCIALSHNPEAAPELWARGAGLVMSGHTHGGQFWVRKWTEAFYQSVLKVRYVTGWYRHEQNQVYVNPGVGSSVVPFRYGRPAMRTVAVLDLEGGSPEPSVRDLVEVDDVVP